MPRTIAEMVPLPGVGRKTANVVLGHAYGINEGIAVDTHVLRVSNRLGIAESDDPLKVEAQLMGLSPARALDAHDRPPRSSTAGRSATRGGPLCGVCPVFALCAWESRQAWASGGPRPERSVRGMRPAPGGRAARRAKVAARAVRRPAARPERPPRGGGGPDDERARPRHRGGRADDVDDRRRAQPRRRRVARGARRGARGAPRRRFPRTSLSFAPRASRCPTPQTLDGPWVSRMAALAPGSASRSSPAACRSASRATTRVHNTSVLLGPDGRPIAVYRKIHLFDIDLPGMEHLKESKARRPRRRGRRRRHARRPPRASRSATTCASPSCTAS